MWHTQARMWSVLIENILCGTSSPKARRRMLSTRWASPPGASALWPRLSTLQTSFAGAGWTWTMPVFHPTCRSATASTWPPCPLWFERSSLATSKSCRNLSDKVREEDWGDGFFLNPGHNHYVNYSGTIIGYLCVSMPQPIRLSLMAISLSVIQRWTTDL